MPNAIVETTETCGIEFECENQTPSSVRNFSGWRANHDASIETDYFSVGRKGLLLKSPIKFLPYQRTTIGTELVSPILKITEDAYPQLKELTNLLTTLGEDEHGTRSGIHFHISFPNPSLKMLKSLLRIGQYLESAFFSIGGMGNKFRGEENDSTYTRPITNEGPICVHTTNGPGQIFVLEDLLSVKRQEDFWNLYGDVRNYGGRYVPVRYHWLNLYPMCPYSGEYRGTVEFRIFNKSLNPDFIYSALILCKKFTEYAMLASLKDLKSDNLIYKNSVFDTPFEGSVNALKYFSHIVELDGEVLKTLLNMMKRTGPVNLKAQYIWTHLRVDYPFFRGLSYCSPNIPSSVIKKPNYIDLHVLRGERG